MVEKRSLKNTPLKEKGRKYCENRSKEHFLSFLKKSLPGGSNRAPREVALLLH